MSRIVAIREVNSFSCPSCGSNKYEVLKPDATIVDAYGNEKPVKEGARLVAVCGECGNPVYIPWVEEINRKERAEENKRYYGSLVKKGYKIVGIDDVMEKYGIENFEDLNDIVIFSGFALDYSDEYEEGFDELLQDMYDIPLVFRNCIDWCYGDSADEEIRDRLDRYWDVATELSRRVCDNLVYIYDAEIVVFGGTKEEPFQIMVNGTPIEESLEADNPMEVHYAIRRAIDKSERLAQSE